MRPVDKSLFTTNQIVYNPYGNAKSDLINAIGKYCSYCEREGFSSSLDVEHIQDKSTYPTKQFLWNNFLLACKNCNSIKGAKEVDSTNIVVPHVDNTFSPFEYLESGYIKIKDEIAEPLRGKVVNLVNLIGLDRRPGHPNYSSKDDRWQERKQAWELSKKYTQKYSLGKCDIDTIVDLSKSMGFWSIWMNAFDKFPEVQEALINNFDGTNQAYF